MSTLNLLENLISIPSVSQDNIHCHKIIQLATEALAANQVRGKLLNTSSGPTILWGETDLSKTTWVINSHLDVVPGSPEQFLPRIDGDKLLGRGSADTKGCAAILINNSSSWISLAREKKITFMLVSDEEVGGMATRELVAKMPNLQGAIFLEPTQEQLIVRAKGIAQVKITAAGAATHGSRPWEGENALEKIVRQLVFFRLNHPQPVQETRATTFNFSLFHAGTAINQVPSTAELWCDIRFNPSDNIDQIVTDLKICFNDSQIEVVKHESPIDCPVKSDLRNSFARSLLKQGINPINSFDHGSSDARHCTARGIPALVFGPKGKNMHAENEWVSLKSLAKVSSVLDHWIKNI